jgi:hypothetical protein
MLLSVGKPVRVLANPSLPLVPGKAADAAPGTASMASTASTATRTTDDPAFKLERLPMDQDIRTAATAVPDDRPA